MLLSERTTYYRFTSPPARWYVNKGALFNNLIDIVFVSKSMQRRRTKKIVPTVFKEEGRMDKHLYPRIAIVGAGAVGSLLGGMLARHGKNVTLIGRKAHVEVIQQQGLTIDGLAGEFTVAIQAAESLDFSPDIVFIAVKTQDVDHTCKHIKPYIGNIPIIMMQNGVISSEIAGSIFGKEKIISCILLLNVRFQTPGVVTYVSKNPIVVGDAFTKSETRIYQIQMLLDTVAGTEISENILGVQWSKLFINAMSNALDGITGLPLGEYVHSRAVRRVGILILKEASHLVNTAGIHLESLPGIPLPLLKLMISLLLPLSTWLLKYVMSSKGNNDIMTSTLQSLRRGKKTEIDFLNGEFVRLGKQIGVPTPVNTKIVELIHKIERGGSFYSPEEVARMFSQRACRSTRH